LFSLFSSIWIPGAARGEKKPEKKCPQAIVVFEWQYLVADMPFIGRG
jgi:hypothetical protein